MDADGKNGGGGFGDEEADSWLSREEFVVEGASAFREHEHTTAVFEDADGGLEAGRVRLVAVDGDGLPTAEDAAHDRVGEEGFAGEKMDRFIEGLANERRVEEGDVIAADESGTVEFEACRVDDAEIKKAMGHLTEETVTDGVAEVHGEAALQPEMGD